MFSIMTIASSTTKPVAMVSAISERLLRLKPQRYMTPNVPTSESGTERLGISVDGSADGRRAIGQDRDIDRRRQGRLEARQQRLDAVDHGDHVGAGLALHVEDDGRHVV